MYLIYRMYTRYWRLGLSEGTSASITINHSCDCAIINNSIALLVVAIIRNNIILLAVVVLAIACLISVLAPVVDVL